MKASKLAEDPSSAQPSRGSTALVTLQPQKASHTDDLVIVSDPSSRAAETVRALRTHLMVRHVDVGRRALAVCGASQGVGCTFLAANLAASMAQIGEKVLLIDADLRAPGLGAYVAPVRPNLGLRQYLADPTVELSDVIEFGPLPQFSIIHAGGAASNPQELLANERFEELLQVCMRDFDITIIDTSPANVSADVRRVASVAGYAVVVSKKNMSLVEDVRTLVNEISGDGARVVGSVLNVG